jgi:urease alpha subunit
VFDIAVCMHTDGLNESGELEETVAAIDGRTITRTTWRAWGADTSPT